MHVHKKKRSSDMDAEGARLYTYADLWDQVPIVEKSSENSLRSLRSLTQFMKARVELDRTYHRDLARLVKKFALGGSEMRGSTSEKFFLGLSGFTSNTAENSLLFSAKCKEHMENPLEALERAHAQNIKVLSARSQQLAKTKMKKEKELNDARNTCEKLCLHSEQARLAYQGALNKSASKETLRELALAAATRTKKAVHADEKYVALIKHMRNFRAQYAAGMSQVLGEYEKAEVYRLNRSMACMKQYMEVYEEKLKVELSNTQKVIGLLGKVNVKGDCHRFARMYRTGKPHPSPPEYTTFKGHPMFIPNIAPLSSSSLSSTSAASASTSPRSNKGHPMMSPFKLNHNNRQYNKTNTHTHKSIHQGDSLLTINHHSSSHLSSSSASTSSSFPSRSSSDTKSDTRLRLESALIALTEKIITRAQIERVEFERIKQILSTAEGREAFAWVLRIRRSMTDRDTAGPRMALDANAFNLLAGIIMIFLDEAKKTMHSAPVQQVMIMSQSFFRYGQQNKDSSRADRNADADASADHAPQSSAPSPSPSPSSSSSSSSSSVSTTSSMTNQMAMTIATGTTRVYLQSAIKHHPIWQQKRLWEESFFELFSTKLKDKKRPTRDLREYERQEALTIERNIVFSSLGTIAHNMCEFDVDRSIVKAFVEKQATLNALDDDMLDMLLGLECLSMTVDGIGSTSSSVLSHACTPSATSPSSIAASATNTAAALTPSSTTDNNNGTSSSTDNNSNNSSNNENNNNENNNNENNNNENNNNNNGNDSECPSSVSADLSSSPFSQPPQSQSQLQSGDRFESPQASQSQLPTQIQTQITQPGLPTQDREGEVTSSAQDQAESPSPLSSSSQSSVSSSSATTMNHPLAR